MLTVLPLTAIDEVRPGDALVEVIARAMKESALRPEPGDVLVVTQKIVSKAERRFVDLALVSPSDEAKRLAAITRKDARLVELVLSESTAVVRAVPHVLITRHYTGHVMANAGIDQSNVGSTGEFALLLPQDSDASAKQLHLALTGLYSVDFGVVISDSFGRPWRCGVTNVALGASGFPALVDRRGAIDRDGRILEVTQIALADMAASAAGLVMGEAAEGIPAALIRGMTWSEPSRPAAALIRPVHEDLFR